MISRNRRLRHSARLLCHLLGVAMWLMWPACTTHAQSGPEKGGHELQVWSGGGHGINGIASETEVWNVGARYGWIVTDPRGTGFVRGRFEYAVDVVPFFWLFQKTGTAYGVSIDPIVLKWNFGTHPRYVPYFELTGGVLFTNVKVPEETSHVNFTTGASVGTHIIRKNFNWSAEIRFMHISNASITPVNPGINTLQVRIGIGRFTQPGRASP